MPPIYFVFDYPSEEKAQEARHKLELWKQASRLDKKLLYKFERAATSETAEAAEPEALEKSEKSAKKAAAKSSEKTKDKTAAPKTAPSEPVKLLVRVAFSSHEKLTEQRFLDRLQAEELFQSASPETIKPSDSGFSEIESRFEDLA